MAELKTRKNEESVTQFLNSVQNVKRKQDAFKMLDIMQQITGESPAMWGSNIVGFGSYHYKYASGREGDWMLTGFSPRKQSLSVYIMSGFSRYDDLLSKLGKFKTGKSCLYINKLEDVSEEVLRKLISASVEFLRLKN